jgi:hypothetical protein
VAPANSIIANPAAIILVGFKLLVKLVTFPTPLAGIFINPPANPKTPFVNFLNAQINPFPPTMIPNTPINALHHLFIATSALFPNSSFSFANQWVAVPN